MELLKSKKFQLPRVLFITDRAKIKEISIGSPFIFGDEKDKEHIIRLLEYEILYQKAVELNLPFNFKKILEENGFEELYEYEYSSTTYMDYKTEGIITTTEESEQHSLNESNYNFNLFIKDAGIYVDIRKIKELNLFPIWTDKLEQAISTNIHNFIMFNPNMYNKKLGGVYGGMELTTPFRTLIIIDISSSIPRGISATILTYAKNLAEAFYSDILITGSISTLYTYEEVYTLDIETIYDVNGMSNEQVYFKKLLTETTKHYSTAIVFGDNHHPGGMGAHISDEDGKKICKWKVDKLISFHTTSDTEIAGYSRWFDVEETNIERITDWVKYL